MNNSRAACGLLLVLVLTSAAGCRKSGEIIPSAPLAPTALSSDTIIRLHWMGKRELGITAGAFTFKRYWDLDQSKHLESRTLDKLSIAPWRFLQGEAMLESAPGYMLRVLLDDMVQEECYFEARGGNARPVELVFAIQLNEQRAGLWRTNLAVVTGSLVGVPNMDLGDHGHSWSIMRHDPPLRAQLVQAGEWTVVGLAQQTNALLVEIVARINRDRTPFVSSGTNLWLEANMDMYWVLHKVSPNWISSENLPRLSFNVTGDGGTVITRGDLHFPQPLALDLEPWTIPADLMHEPLVGFTAVRGFKPWLALQKSWIDQSPDATPNQLYFWAQEGGPFRTWFAAPLPEAGNHVRRFTQRLMEKANLWLATNGYVGFEPLPDDNGVMWGTMTNLLPFLKSVESTHGSMVYGGLTFDVGSLTNSPPPPEMIQDVLRRTNLVYYDWEKTSQRADSWLYLAQTIREISRQRQMPMDSAGIAWLNMLRPRLGSTATVVTQTETNQLTFVRRSTFGFTGMELHLLADWFESPQFPRGLYSLLGPPVVQQPK